MNMKTVHIAVCLALLTPACGSVTFAVADDDGGTADANPSSDVQPDAKKVDPKPDAGHSCTASCSKVDDAGSDAGHVIDSDAGHDAGDATDAVAPEDSGCCGMVDGMVDAGSDVGTGHPDAGKDSSEPDVKTSPDSGHDVDGGEDSGHAEDAGKDSAMVCQYTTPKCSGNILLTCGDGGTEAEPCTGTTPICLEVAGVGTCVPCAPGTASHPNTQCDPSSLVATPTQVAGAGLNYFSNIQTCNSQGQWASAQPGAAKGSSDACTYVCSGAAGAAACTGVCTPLAAGCGVIVTAPYNESCQGQGTLGAQTCDDNGIWGAFSYPDNTFVEGAAQTCSGSFGDCSTTSQACQPDTGKCPQ
jgi:hypothetical protein